MEKLGFINSDLATVEQSNHAKQKGLQFNFERIPLATIQRWLREEHEIFVIVQRDAKWMVQVTYVKGDELIFIDESFDYKTYEDALGMGLFSALDYLR